ncbi:hypothetical protein E2C01_061708 [Portunus trituberculatus]|uniref:Uncharacterized protein n=1 Tax=Portunus trituberculatus TaxID=210409 RepID=A0A5B7H4K8_PORTR|nr:hypothetical protein [Portunus trituberculatus]
MFTVTEVRNSARPAVPRGRLSKARQACQRQVDVGAVQEQWQAWLAGRHHHAQRGLACHAPPIDPLRWRTTRLSSLSKP